MNFKEEIKQKMEEKLKGKLGRSLNKNEKGNLLTDTGLLNEILTDRVEALEKEVNVLKKKLK